MTQWEYEVLRWSFRGAREDDWPEQEAFRAAYDSAGRTGPRLPSGVHNPWADPDVQRLQDEYNAWRRDREFEWLNAYGSAGYELVAYQRDERGVMHAVFKREKSDVALSMPSAPLPPPVH